MSNNILCKCKDESKKSVTNLKKVNQVIPSRYCEEGRFYVQIKTQGRIFLHVPARGFKEICRVLLARQSISFLLPLNWSGTSTVYFYQTFESASTSSLSSLSRYSNHNIPRGHANFKQVLLVY